tara:strand:- start:3672 stop:3866 length:195 start_codon:yes stop_codon:yes gene_type:complete
MFKQIIYALIGIFYIYHGWISYGCMSDSSKDYENNAKIISIVSLILGVIICVHNLWAIKTSLSE